MVAQATHRGTHVGGGGSRRDAGGEHRGGGGGTGRDLDAAGAAPRVRALHLIQHGASPCHVAQNAEPRVLLKVPWTVR